MIFSGIIEAISTIDWPGRSATVIFFNGCNFNCLYCSNVKYIQAANQQIEPLYKGGCTKTTDEVKNIILETKPYISAVVFSGGEPTTQKEVLRDLAIFVKSQGLLVGIETNGYYPDRLKSLIREDLIDKIFLDIKAPLNSPGEYEKITGGIKDAAEKVRDSLNLQGIEIEARTTAFRGMDVPAIARSLGKKRLKYVIQQGIPEYAPDEQLKALTPLTREELVNIARSIPYLNNISIRYRPPKNSAAAGGEEQIIDKTNYPGGLLFRSGK